MERKDSITREVRAILRSPSFQRSPSLAAILEYLLSRDLAGDGSPTQYDIAREALRKDSDFNETIDSSVRVQISRLRKALADYYLTHQPADGLCVFIRVGEYRLRTARLEIAYPEIAKAHYRVGGQAVHSADLEVEIAGPNGSGLETPTASGPSRIAQSFTENFRVKSPFIAILALVGIISLVLVVPTIPLTGSDGDEEIPALVAAPYVNLDVTTSGRADLPANGNALVERVRSKARELLLKSMVSRLEPDAGNTLAGYNLTVTLKPNPDGLFGLSVILADNMNRVISEHFVSGGLTEAQAVEITEDEIVRIISPAGDITRHIAKKLDGKPQSAFECFIAIEGVRIRGANDAALLNDCIKRFPSDEFSPYLHVRKTFASLQAKSMAGEAINENSPEWRLISRILRENPENSYANTLAAKLLISQGDCSKALRYANNALSRGRTFPALELAIISDAYGCEGMSNNRPDWNVRISRIIRSNREPHDLLETLILLSALMSQQENLLGDFESAFSQRDMNSPMGQFNLALIAAASGRASTGDMMLVEEILPAFLFNADSREFFLANLRELNGSTNGNQSEDLA